MNAFQLLNESYRLVKRRRFIDASVILEKICDRAPEAYPLFLLAVSYLYQGKIGRCQELIGEINRREPGYPPVEYLQAYLGMKGASGYEEALAYYVDLLQKYPDSSDAEKALHRLQKSAGSFVRFQKKARLHRFVPLQSPPSFLKKKLEARYISGFERQRRRRYLRENKDGEKAPGGTKGRYVFIIVLFLAAVFASSYYYFMSVMKKKEGLSKSSKEVNETVDMVRLGGGTYDLLQKINREKVHYLYHSPGKILADFKRAKVLIKNRRGNEAVQILNRLYYSNAGFRVKEKAEFLICFVSENNERNFERTNIKKIVSKPRLYRGTAVSWMGRVTNYREKAKSSTFTLLVGYTSKDVFDGIAEVFSGTKDFSLKNGDMIRCDGVVTDTLGKGNRIHLRAVYIETI